MQNSTVKKLKYYIYEGSPESRDETFTFRNKKAALDYVRTQIVLKNAVQAQWIAHVMLSKDCSFVASECTDKYYEVKATVDAEEAAWQARMAQETKRNEIREAFIKIEYKCEELFRQASPIRHAGHQDAWLLCASALDNASDTCQERGWEYEGLEYWECALSSLESLCCYASPRVRRWFKKIGFKF